MSPFAIYKITFIHSHLCGRDASQVQRSSSTNSLPSSRTLINSPLLSPLHTNMFNFFTSQINITLSITNLISLLHLTMFLEISVFTDSNSSHSKYHLLLLLLHHFSCVRLCMTPQRQPTRILCPQDSPGKITGVGCHFLLQSMKVKSESEVTQSCLTPRNPMDCSLQGSSVHGIFQARILE